MVDMSFNYWNVGDDERDLSMFKFKFPYEELRSCASQFGALSNKTH